MTERFLIDTSALVRLYRRQCGSGWDHAVTAGLVGMCEPVRQEFLRAVGGTVAFHEADGLLRELYPFHVLRDSVWEETAALQRRLAMRGWHQCASPIHLVVAVTAAHHKLTVLHNDRDFETISRITGQPVRRIE